MCVDLVELLLDEKAASLSGQVLKCGRCLMNVLEKLTERWRDIDYPFLVHSSGELRFGEIAEQKAVDVSEVKSGDVVALIGDFDPQSILTLLQLIDKNVILVPLTVDTRAQHEYFFESALVDVVIEGEEVKRITHSINHEIIESLRSKEHAGLVPFFNWNHWAAKSHIARFNTVHAAF